MKVIKTGLEGLIVIEPKVYRDSRGYFFESFSQREFNSKVSETQFVQDNESYSEYGVLRGLHFQRAPFSQAKLVRVVKGRVLDVAVDIRPESPTYGKHQSVELSDDNKLQMFIPHGFAHGFIVLSDEAILQYKCDNYYSPEHEGAIIWNDRDLNVDWLLPESDIILSEKDKANLPFGSILY